MVRTPLPMAVAGALTQLIGSAWPSAVIDTSGRHTPYGDGLVMLVDPKPAPKRVTKKHAAQLAAKAEEVDGDQPAHFLRFREDGTIEFTLPDEVRLFLGEAAHALMSQSTSPNYIEWEVTWPGDVKHGHAPASYVLSVARSQGQTPHVLRTKAESELADLRATVARACDALWAESQGDGTRMREAGTVQDHIEQLRADVLGIPRD